MNIFLLLDSIDGGIKKFQYFFVLFLFIQERYDDRMLYHIYCFTPKWTSWRPWCLPRRRAWLTRPVRWVWQTFGFLWKWQSASCCIWPTLQIPSRSFQRCHWWTSSWSTSPLRKSQYPGVPASRLCRCRSCTSRLSSSTSSRRRLWRSSLLVSFLLIIKEKLVR